MIKNLDEWLDKTFSKGRRSKGEISGQLLNPHVAVLVYFYRQPNTITNITELSRVCNRACPTIRRVVDDLVEVGILQEEGSRGAHYFTLKISKRTTAIFEFFRKIEAIIKVSLKIDDLRK